MRHLICDFENRLFKKLTKNIGVIYNIIRQQILIL